MSSLTSSQLNQFQQVSSFQAGSSQLFTLEQSTYASSILSVMLLFFAKASVLSLINSLTPVESHRRINKGLRSFLALWMLSSCLVLIFQCSPPHVWQSMSEHCINSVSIVRYLKRVLIRDQATFTYYFGTINILSDVLLVGHAFHVILGVQMKRSHKLAIASCFGSRML